MQNLMTSFRVCLCVYVGVWSEEKEEKGGGAGSEDAGEVKIWEGLLKDAAKEPIMIKEVRQVKGD